MSAERGKADGVRAFSFHPGTILDTGLAAHVSSEELRAAGVIKENAKPIRNPARNLKAVEQGVRDEPTARRNGRRLLRERGHPHFWSPLTPQPVGNSETRCCTSA